MQGRDVHELIHKGVRVAEDYYERVGIIKGGVHHNERELLERRAGLRATLCRSGCIDA